MWGGVTSAEGTARHRRRRRQVRHPDGEGHRRPAHRHARHQEGGPARRLGRPRQGRLRLGPRLRQGPAHREDLRRHRLVPLRHAGFDRASASASRNSCGARGRPPRSRWRSPAARATAPRRPARTSASICVDSGYEIHFAGAAGLDIKGTEVLGLVKTEDEALEVHRGAGADVPRAGPLSRAHLQMGEARRRRRDPPPDARRSPRSAKPSSTASSSRQKFAQVDPWSERVSGKDKHEFRPMATVGFAQAAE